MTSARFRPLRHAGLLLCSLLLAACSFSELTFRDAKNLIASGQADAGMAKLERLVAENPGNAEYRAYQVRQQELRSNRLIAQAQTALINEDFDGAARAYAEALRADSQNPRVLSGMRAVEDAKRFRSLVLAADAAASSDPEQALGLLRMVLSENPSHPGALMLKRRIEADRHQLQLMPPQLSAAFKKPVTLQFRDAAISEVFQALAQVAGLSFVFDKDVVTSSKVTLFASNLSVEDALSVLLTTSQLEKKILGDSALLIYPNNPAKKADYQENVVKSFYIGNADPKQTMNLVKTMARSRDVFIDEKLGLLTVRDTLDNIRIIEKLIAAQDLAEPEVMLEVEILEVATSRLMNLGIEFPEKVSLTPFSTNPVLTGGQTAVTGASVASTSSYARGLTTLKELGRLSSNKVLASIGDPGAVINLRAQDGATNLLANPRIRVKSREKAKVRIGDKLPVITTTTASTGVTSESVQYLDVGLALDVDPVVHPDNQVSMKLALEVSNQLDTVTSKSGLVTYKIGTRRAETSLRLKDGETQILGGLIRREERDIAAKLPGLGDLPVLGRLFGSTSDNVDKTEIVLLVTPRILRRTELPPVNITEFAAGSDNYALASPLRLQGNAKISVTPPSGSTAMAAVMPPSGAPAINPANGLPMAPQADDSIIVTFTLDAPPRVAVGQPVDLRILSLMKKDVRLLNLEIDFDGNKLEYVSSKVGGLMGSSGGTPQFEVKQESPGRLRLIVQNAGGAKGSGDLGTITFKGKQSAAEPAMIGFGGIFANDMNNNQVTIMAPDPRPVIVSP